MATDKTFWVNLKKEDLNMLRTKLNWILDEIQSRVNKANDNFESNNVRAITKAMKAEMSDSEIIENVKRWFENPQLKVTMCLNYLKKNDWKVTKSDFLEYSKSSLDIKKPDLFLLSLTKTPYIREWTNINDEKRKARDYGNVLKIKEGFVILNPVYASRIISIWRSK